jgi:hypothetical protein
VASRNRVTRRFRDTGQGVFDSLRGGAADIVQSVANEVAPGVVGAIDVDDLIQRVDVQAIVDRIDLQGLVGRLDLNELLARIDLDLLLSRIDLDRLLARIDVAEVIERVDVNAVVEQLDVDALVERTELGSIIARSGVGVAGKALDVVRSLGVSLDSLLHRSVDRLLRRDTSSGPGGPPLLVGGG